MFQKWNVVLVQQLADTVKILYDHRKACQERKRGWFAAWDDLGEMFRRDNDDS
jgi:hypothetical protein